MAALVISAEDQRNVILCVLRTRLWPLWFYITLFIKNILYDLFMKCINEFNNSVIYNHRIYMFDTIIVKNKMSVTYLKEIM